MYLEHFGLRELPFGITPDTSFAFAGTAHQEALNTLLIALRSGEGFIKITGEVGTGKTLLCRRFLAELDGDFVTAYIPNPYLDPLGLLLALADELRIAFDRDNEQHHLVKALNHALLDYARAGKRVVVCLYEAQAMPLETLEWLRLLSISDREAQVVPGGAVRAAWMPAEDESVRQLQQRITTIKYFRRCRGGANITSATACALPVMSAIGVSPFRDDALYRAAPVCGWSTWPTRRCGGVRRGQAPCLKRTCANSTRITAAIGRSRCWQRRRTVCRRCRLWFRVSMSLNQVMRELEAATADPGLTRAAAVRAVGGAPGQCACVTADSRVGGSWRVRLPGAGARGKRSSPDAAATPSADFSAGSATQTTGPTDPIERRCDGAAPVSAQISLTTRSVRAGAAARSGETGRPSLLPATEPTVPASSPLIRQSLQPHPIRHCRRGNRAAFV